jgi:hypothetical protein
MQADNRRSYNIGNTTKEDIPLVEPNKIINLIIANIDVFKKNYIEGKNERGLNNNFVICMNDKLHNQLFFFHHEYVEDPTNGQSHQIDIGIIPRGQKKAFFVIEAKRLDKTIKSSRKKEYIIGKIGGIERFKRDKHARDFIYAGMIGYIQSDHFNDWEDKINAWLTEEIKPSSSDELTWTKHDKLAKINSTNEIAKYSSYHSCLSGKQINLLHLWINLA